MSAAPTNPPIISCIKCSKSHIPPLLAIISLCCLIIVTDIGHAAEEDSALSVRGYFKNYFLAIAPARYTVQGEEHSDPVEGAVYNRANIKLLWQPSDNFTFSASYNLRPVVEPVQDSSVFNTQSIIDASKYRVADLHTTLYPASGTPDGSFYLGQNLDRCMVSLSFDWGDLHLGRQALSFGMAHIINPTDVLAPFTYQDLDTEERYGIDAVTLQIPLGIMGEFGAGVVVGDEANRDNSAAFLKLKGYLLNTDMDIIFMDFRNHGMLGLNMMRTVGGAGTWFEAAYVWENLFQSSDDVEKGGYLRTSLGLDYNLADGLYSWIEYHYSEPGSRRTEDYGSITESMPYREGTVYLLAQHYLVPGLTYQLTPLVTVNLSSIFNINDGSAFINSSLDYNLSENVYVTAGAYVGVGPGLEVTAEGAGGFSTHYGSEFGIYPDIYYTTMRIYW